MKAALAKLLPLLGAHRRALVLGLIALVVKDLLGVAMPLVIREGVDALTRGFELRGMLLFAAVLLGLSAIKGLFQFWMRVLVIGVSRDVEYDLRNRLFTHLLTLDPGYYARQRTGDLMARATNDMNAVRMMLGPGVMYSVETSLTFVLAVAVMLYTDWRLTLLALAPTPLVTFAVIAFGRRIHTRFQKIQALFSDISSRLQESLNGVRVVRAYVQEAAQARDFEVLNRDYIRQNLRLAVLSGLFHPALEALIALSFLIVLWAGGRRLLTGDITLGTFLMFNVYMGMLTWPLIALGWVTNLMQRGLASWARVEELFAARPAITAPPEPVRIGAVEGRLEMRGVTVRFGETTALDNVDLDIPAGSTLAIVGHTGSGKTTLVSLLARLLDPSEGVVLLDGHDLRTLDPADLRAAFGCVPQETFLFSATLAENIAFGVPGAPEPEIQRAADLAGLSPDIASFPDRLATRVGERGITLSGGQKQRTAIARAILRDPRILILDDALSSVDTITEERILGNLAGVMSGRTTVIISHRISTVRGASHIVVLEGGRIIESGTHDALITAGGYYADLHQKQLLEEELEAI